MFIISRTGFHWHDSRYGMHVASTLLYFRLIYVQMYQTINGYIQSLTLQYIFIIFYKHRACNEVGKSLGFTVPGRLQLQGLFKLLTGEVSNVGLFGQIIQGCTFLGMLPQKWIISLLEPPQPLVFGPLGLHISGASHFWGFTFLGLPQIQGCLRNGASLFLGLFFISVFFLNFWGFVIYGAFYI